MALTAEVRRIVERRASLFGAVIYADQREREDLEIAAHLVECERLLREIKPLLRLLIPERSPKPSDWLYVADPKAVEEWESRIVTLFSVKDPAPWEGTG